MKETWFLIPLRKEKENEKNVYFFKKEKINKRKNSWSLFQIKFFFHSDILKRLEESRTTIEETVTRIV